MAGSSSFVSFFVVVLVEPVAIKFLFSVLFSFFSFVSFLIDRCAPDCLFFFLISISFWFLFFCFCRLNSFFLSLSLFVFSFLHSLPFTSFFSPSLLLFSPFDMPFRPCARTHSLSLTFCLLCSVVLLRDPDFTDMSMNPVLFCPVLSLEFCFLFSRLFLVLAFLEVLRMYVLDLYLFHLSAQYQFHS